MLYVTRDTVDIINQILIDGNVFYKDFLYVLIIDSNKDFLCKSSWYISRKVNFSILYKISKAVNDQN